MLTSLIAYGSVLCYPLKIMYSGISIQTNVLKCFKYML